MKRMAEFLIDEEHPMTEVVDPSVDAELISSWLAPLLDELEEMTVARNGVARCGAAIRYGR